MHNKIGSLIRAPQDKLLVVLMLISIALVATAVFRVYLTATHPGQPDTVANLLAQVNREAPKRLIQTLRPTDLDAPLRDEAYARFDGTVQSEFSEDPETRVRLWHSDGSILYANEAAEVAGIVGVPTELQDAWQGEQGVKITLRDGPANKQTDAINALIATYTPVQFAEESQPRSVLEIVQRLGPAPTAQGALDSYAVELRPLGMVVLSIVLSYFGLTLFIWRERRTIHRLYKRLQTTSAYLHSSTALLREVHERGLQRHLMD